jgi:phasin family protein
MANAKKTAHKNIPQIDDAIDAGMNAAETVVKSNTEAAVKGYETMVSMGREAVSNACKAGHEVKGFEAVADMPKANFEAMVEAGNVFMKGFESLNGQLFAIARKQIAEGVETQKALMGAKTFQEAVEIQQGFVKKSMDRVVSDGVELSSAWMKVATEAGQPIGRRVSDVVAETAHKAA